MKKSIFTYSLFFVLLALGNGCASTMQSKKVVIAPSKPSASVGTQIIPPAEAEVFSNIDLSILKNYIQAYNKGLNNNDASVVADAIMLNSNKYKVHYKVITALVAIESGFRPDAKSSSGAMGLGQLMPMTARSLSVKNPWDPYQNLDGAVGLLRSHLEKYNGNINYALAAYKMGSGAVSRNGISQNSTINYIKKIRSIYDVVP